MTGVIITIYLFGLIVTALTLGYKNADSLRDSGLTAGLLALIAVLWPLTVPLALFGLAKLKLQSRRYR